MEVFLYLVLGGVGILQIALFCKTWKMTNDVRKLTDHFCEKQEHPAPKQISEEERNNAAKHTLGHLK